MLRVFKFLDTIQKEFLLGERGCSFECSSILLGALLKELHQHKLRDPRPEPPFIGLNLTDLFKTLQQFRNPEWYTQARHARYDSYRDRHVCSLASHVEEQISQVQRFITQFWDEKPFRLDEGE